MPRNLLIRGLTEDDITWLESTTPPGMSQAAYLRQILREAQVSKTSPSKKAVKEAKAEFRFIDLFAGIGGFHAGMKSAGGHCVYANEWDKFAAVTYSAFTGHASVDTRDIREVNYAQEIPDHDVLTAGFPCQPFSIAGVSKKNSLGRKHGFEDERQGNLFFAICDIAAKKRPPIMILENVKNLKSHDKGNTFKVISQMLDDLGYAVHTQILDAQAWVPQHRERIFIVCFDKVAFTQPEIEGFRFPVLPATTPQLGSILESNPDRKYMLTDNLWSYLQRYAAKHRAAGNGFGYGLVTHKDVARTLSARYYKDGSEILVKQPRWRNPRRLTPGEAARLMGFDAKFAKLFGHDGAFPQVVSDTQAYKQFGNSVCPYVTAAVGKEAVKVLKKMRERTGPSQNV